ncbi:hypothetical protein MTR67_049849, partial [Solanum verrucosum]
RKQILNKKGNKLRKVLFRYASSIHETDLRTVDGSTARAGTLAVLLYGSTVRSVDQSTDRQWALWFHTWSDFPDLSSLPCLLIYGHNLRTVNGPTVRRSPPWMPFFCNSFSCP